VGSKEAWLIRSQQVGKKGSVEEAYTVGRCS